MTMLPVYSHLNSSVDLETTYEATRAGFVALALEKNRRATPFVAEARALQSEANKIKKPSDLLDHTNIQAALLTAAGLSEKAISHLQLKDKTSAVQELIKNFLEPAGAKFVEELVFRFLLTRGDALGGSMRNIAGVLAQQKLTRAILAFLNISGIKFEWQDSKSRKWFSGNDDPDIEGRLRSLGWKYDKQDRVLIYNLTVPVIQNNVDLCLIRGTPRTTSKIDAEAYLALGELKGGIDPAGADEHWKTARTALERIRKAFDSNGYHPNTFFIGAAIEKKMADEIWNELQDGTLTNAANLNNEEQLTSIAKWICTL